MKFSYLLISLLCFHLNTLAQFQLLSQEQYDIRSNAAFKGAKVRFKTPKQFHRIKLSDTIAERGVFVSDKLGLVASFHELLANKDTSVVIGIYVSGDYREHEKHMDRKENAKQGFIMLTRCLRVSFVIAKIDKMNGILITGWNTMWNKAKYLWGGFSTLEWYP